MDQDNVDFGSDEVDGFSTIQRPADMGSFKMMHTPVVSSQTASSIVQGQMQYASLIGKDITCQELNLHALEAMG
eukprot:c15173_g1_i1 orf=151-372(+)